MKRPREDDIRIATEAAQWQRALQDGDTQVHAEFADWIKASPRHLREFMFMEALDGAARKVDPDRKIEIDLDLAGFDDKVVPLAKSNEGRAAPAFRISRWRRVAMAASVLVTVLGMTWWFAPSLIGGWDRYGTAIGEQRTIELEDGSVLQLNTKSSVRVRFSRSARDIQLIAGEALFKVAHDSARPFRVNAGDTVIRAVGTQFDVYRRASNTTVAVLEGKVQILTSELPAELNTTLSNEHSLPEREPGTPSNRNEAQANYLAAGQAARIGGDGKVVRDALTDISDAVSWRQRRLVFREETLAAIAEEFNRYNRRPQLVIEGEAAGARRYGGTFDADDPESLVQFVTRRGDLHIDRMGSRIVIRGR